MLALLLATALASTGMSTETEKESPEIDGARLRIIPIHWGADIFDVAPLPNSAVWRAGYKCSVFGLFWTYFAVWDCTPVAYSDAGYDPSPQRAQWISRNYSMDDAKRGFWNEHGRWFFLGFLVLSVVGLILGDTGKKESQTAKQQTFRKLSEWYTETPSAVMEQYGRDYCTFTGVITALVNWEEGSTRTVVLRELGEDRAVRFDLDFLEKMHNVGAGPKLLLDEGLSIGQTIRLTGRLAQEFRVDGSGPPSLSFTPLEPVEVLGIDGWRIPIVPPDYSTPQQLALASIGLSTRALNCLARQGITQVQEVNEMSDEELLAVKNFGPAGLAELRNKVSRLQIDSND